MSEQSGVRVLDFKSEYEGEKRTVYVLLAPRGEAMQSTQTWHRVKKLRPPKEHRDDEGDSIAAMRARWELIEPAYNAYLNDEELPENGVPLAVLAVLSKDQADYLKKQGYATIEDVSEISDTVAMKWPWPNAKRLPALAKEYLENKDKAQMAEEKQEMADRISVLEELLQEQMDANKPKRQERPPKQPVETEAA